MSKLANVLEAFRGYFMQTNVTTFKDLYPEPEQLKPHRADLTDMSIKPGAVYESSQDDEENLVTIFIPSAGRETKQKPVLDDDGNPVFNPITGQRMVAKYVYGSINGEPFEVECDRQTRVAPNIAKILVG